jgi:hypothetical protein
MSEGISEVGNSFAHSPVGQAEPLDTRGVTAQSFESNLRLECSRRREVVALSTSFRMRGLTVGDSDDRDGSTDTGNHLEETANPENLVIGVGRHDDDSPRPGEPQWTKLPQLFRSEPSSLVRPRVQVVDN